MGKSFSTHGMQKYVQNFVRETNTEGISGRPRSVPKNNFEMDFTEIQQEYLFRPGQGRVGVTCEQGSENFVSIRGGKFLD